MRLPLFFGLSLLTVLPAYADGLDPAVVVEAAIAIIAADSPTAPPNSGNPPSPEYNPADALSTHCYNDDDCYACMTPAIDLANECYEQLALNHAWKTWADTEYKRMDGIASAATGMTKYTKLAYSLEKSREILPAKRNFERNVKDAQTTTLNSLRSAYEKVGSCEAEFLGEDNFTNMALLAWQIMKVKYVD